MRPDAGGEAKKEGFYAEDLDGSSANIPKGLEMTNDSSQSVLTLWESNTGKRTILATNRFGRRRINNNPIPVPEVETD